MPVRPFVGDRALRINGAATVLRGCVFEPMGKRDPRVMGFVGYRIANWLGYRFDYSVYDKSPGARFDIDLEIDRHEKRRVNRIYQRLENVENCGARFGFPARKNFYQGCALFLAAGIVDYDLRASAALVDRAGPFQNVGPDHSTEIDIAEFTFVYTHRHRGAAIAPRGQGVELTGAAPIAVAGPDLGALNHPLDVTHLCISHLADRKNQRRISALVPDIIIGIS